MPTFLCGGNNVKSVEGEKEQGCRELVSQKPKLDRSANSLSKWRVLIAYVNCVVLLKLSALLSLAHEDEHTRGATEYTVARTLVCLPC